MDETHVIRYTEGGSGVRLDQGTTTGRSLTTESSSILTLKVRETL